MMRAIMNRIIVESISEKTEKTKGGIFLPETLQEKVETGLKGKVVAIGTGFADAPMEVKVGEIIVFGKYAGTIVEDNNGKKYLSMSQGEVLAILDK